MRADFDCSRCPASRQKARRCGDAEFEISDPKFKGVQLLKQGGIKHSFCPARLFRDDTSFVLYAEELFASWKSSQLPQGRTPGETEHASLREFNALVRLWEAHERQEGRRFLIDMASTILGSGKKKGGTKNGNSHRA